MQQLEKWPSDFRHSGNAGPAFAHWIINLHWAPCWPRPCSGGPDGPAACPHGGYIPGRLQKMNNQVHFRVATAAASGGLSSHCGAGVGGWQDEGRSRFRRGVCGRLFCREVRASEASGRSSQLSKHLGDGVSGNGTQGAHGLWSKKAGCVIYWVSPHFSTFCVWSWADVISNYLGRRWCRQF